MFEDAAIGRPARRPFSLPLKVPGRLLIFWGLAAVIVPTVWVTSGALGFEGRVALVTFALAALAWCLTSIGSTYIALIAALVPTMLGFDEPESFFRIVGNALFWLLLGAFIVAAAFTSSGLAQRLAQAIMRGRTTTRGLFLRLTGVILLSALVVPATSSRAALFLPVYDSLGRSLREPRIQRALALLIPVAILLSAAASLIGAGAHLLMVELVVGLGGERIGYFQWLVWGLPFAAASCLLSAWVISRLFLSRAERRRTLAFPDAEQGGGPPLSRKERLVLWVVAALVLLWISEPLHGLHATLVALCGALIVTAPRIGVISLKEGMKAVNWNLLVFMAATIKLGQTLVETGAAAWLIESAFGLVARGPAALVAMVIVVSTLAHLVVTSRTAPLLDPGAGGRAARGLGGARPAGPGLRLDHCRRLLPDPAGQRQALGHVRGAGGHDLRARRPAAPQRLADPAAPAAAGAFRGAGLALAGARSPDPFHRHAAAAGGRVGPDLTSIESNRRRRRGWRRFLAEHEREVDR